MKKIWIMNHYATEMYENEGGRHYWFAKQLIKYGYRPVIFCANTFHTKNQQIAIEQKKYTIKQKNGIPFIFIKTSSYKGNGISRIKNMFLFAFNLLKVAKKMGKIEKPDIIIASSVHPLTCVSGILLAKKLKIPCIVEIRDLWPEAIFFFNKLKENSILGKLLLSGERWIYRKADAIIFTKEGDVDHIKEMKWDVSKKNPISLSKCYYINNGVDLEDFYKSIETNQLVDIKNDEFKVIYAGAIRPVNDVTKLVEAAKILKQKGYSNIRIYIYGRGSEEEKIKEKIAIENIDNVIMKGFVQKKYIPYILSCSSVNILNYSQTQYNWKRGNSSNKMFEYMASGKPIISTVHMGYDLIERYQVGFSLKENTPNDLAEAIIKVYEMKPEEYNQYCNNALKAAKDFDYSVLTQKLIAILEKF